MEKKQASRYSGLIGAVNIWGIKEKTKQDGLVIKTLGMSLHCDGE